ncbi:hypothetical protein CDD83_5990 [Cordyceps sp. RAO-2017]|nr:hypothetical protein CDD83_5990 [Cordyceps sp. RAO-2017]
MVRLTAFVTLGLATLAASQKKGETHYHGQITCETLRNNQQPLPNFSGILYSETNYRGEARNITIDDRGQCLNLFEPVREGFNNRASRSIRIGCPAYDHCTVYQHENCIGSERTYERDTPEVKAKRGIVSIKCRWFHRVKLSHST